MAIETIGEALDHGWRVTVRCACGPRETMKRGRAFPLGLLESRLRCPRCGSRRVRVAFTVPPNSARAYSSASR